MQVVGQQVPSNRNAGDRQTSAHGGEFGESARAIHRNELRD